MISALLALVALLGDPRALFFARVIGLLAALAPCPAGDAACSAEQRRAAATIILVALADADPEDALARLAGAGAHETGFRVRVQEHGPAVSWFQLEVRDPFERARFLADPLAAARRALEIARMCGGSMRSYASGRCSHETEAAAQLRACVESARRGGAWACKNWHSKAKPKRGKKRR